MTIQKVNDWLRNAQTALGLRFRPPPCLLCGGASGELGLCRGCRDDLPWQGSACTRCALPLSGGRICGICLKQPPPQDEVLCVFDYAPPVDYMIQRLKFHGELAWARALGGLMAGEIARRVTEPPDVVVPVPLHRRRLTERGYNQALELARPLARALAVPIDVSLCTRIRPTREQSALGAGARRANLRGAFATAGAAPSSIAIVDDVLTTGSTAGALAHVLRQAGAAHVSIWICARATLSRF